MKKHADLVVVGAGIMGLAHAYHAARAGLSVTVFERGSRAQGASVRNFGMLAIVAQSEGKQRDDALRTLACWHQIAPLAGVELRQSGCLFLAREPEELDVLQEFASSAISNRSNSKMLTPKKLSQYAPAIRTESILGGLWNADAWKVDQRQATNKIASWLERKYGVTFHFSTEVTSITPPITDTSIGTFKFDHCIVCGGNEFSTLFPELFAAAGVTQCQLQMLRTCPQPASWKLDPFILGGLSLPRYSAFADLSSLSALKSLQQSRYKDYLANGIHVIASQESDGSITIGDSHSYGNDHSHERSDVIDKLILEGLDGMISLPEPRIAERWLGHYAYLPDTEVLLQSPSSNVTVVTATHGQGMTHAFAIAEDVILNRV